MRPIFRAAFVLVLFTLVLGGCRKKAEPEAETPAAPADTTAAPGTSLTSLPDSAQLLLIDRLPLQLSYDEVAARISGVGQPEGTGIADLYQAYAPVRIFDRPARLELNFESDRLYAYYYMFENLPCPESQALYDRLRAFYGRHYGPGREERDADGAYRATNSFWEAGDFQVVATRGDQSGRCRLAWGYQKP